MSLLVVGSVALDTVETPFGRVKDAPGGSALYFSAAASYFCSVKVVGVVGNDFPVESVDFLRKRNVNLDGLHVSDGDTFRWSGRYGYDLNERETIETRLNVFASFQPKILESYRDSEYVFLANIDPQLQLDVLKQVSRPKLVACDTMNFWIEGEKDQLLKVLGKADVVIMNDSEVRELAAEPDLLKASRRFLDIGPDVVIVKKGEHGAIMVSKDSFFAIPAFPTELVFDPTGAGDSFAGGLMGYLASSEDVSEMNLRRAMVYGSVMASFNVERFSFERLKDLKDEEIKERFREFKRITYFEEVS